MTPPRRRVLYISYDGLLEPIGRSQILLYLLKLSQWVDFWLITFEKPADLTDIPRLEALKDEVRRAGIKWIPLRYHKSPSVPATALDVMVGCAATLALSVRHRIQIVHARSYVPALIASIVKALSGPLMVFDMRGFWADQKRDCGEWRQGAAVYRLAKLLEGLFFRYSDWIVSLTHAGVERILAEGRVPRESRHFSVIPTCADLSAFVPQRGGSPSDKQPFIVGFLGTLSVSYLFDEMLDVFEAVRRVRPDARLLIINRGDHPRIKAALQSRGIHPDVVELLSVPHEEVPGHIRRMSAAVFLLKTFPSLAGVAPTKLGELLASGVPVLANAGIGDYERIVRQESVGVILDSFSAPSVRVAAERLVALALDPDCRRRCRSAAEKAFSLESGVAEYRRIYESLVP